MKTAILPKPPQAGLLRLCGACNRWFALRLIEVKTDSDSHRVRVYRCKHCGKEVTFADRRSLETL